MGPKTSMAALLLVGAVPFAFVPLVHSFAGLVTIRLVRLLALSFPIKAGTLSPIHYSIVYSRACIGVLGAAFVMAQVRPPRS